MKIIIVEDKLSKNLQPFTYTRRVSRIRIGPFSLERFLQLALPGIEIEFARSAKVEPAVSITGGAVVLNARVVPCKELIDALYGQTSSFIFSQGGKSSSVPALGERNKAGGRGQAVSGSRDFGDFILIENCWDIIKYGEKSLESTFPWQIKNMRRHLKQKLVYLGKKVKIDPWVKFDTSMGPIILADEVVIDPFVILQGPLYIGPKTVVKSHSMIGPFVSTGLQVKLGGEVAHSVIESYSNKAHHGFIGHSYIGSWVNIGAGTSNSNLKNTYGNVRVIQNNKKVDTGMQFLGCMIADYAKTAVNTSLYTGKVVGVAGMCYGVVAVNVPSFAHSTSKGLFEVDLEAVIKMQARMMHRREIKPNEEDVALIKSAYAVSAEERKKAGVKKGAVRF